jgi:hypothetical protein
MSSTTKQSINFADSIKSLRSAQIWEYETGSRGACGAVNQATFEALQRPNDFPPLDAAIVPGDHVAIAVDPNVPGVVEVLMGALKAIKQTEAGEVDVIIGDEASDVTMLAIRAAVGDLAHVYRHSASERASLRYLGADESADPIYLNRRLVDADFVLPIMSARPLDAVGGHDLTGIFPAFADSASRRRYRDRLDSTASEKANLQLGTATDPTLEPAWLLGVQIIISVLARACGDVGQVVAGTPDAIRKILKPTHRLPDEFPPAAPLVIASLDGDQQQQTWANAARAVAAASRFVEANGTIVLWSAINEPPTGRLLGLSNEFSDEPPSDEPQSVSDNDDFPQWNEDSTTARVLLRVLAENRLLIHSQLDSDVIEGMGLGTIDSAEQLGRLSESFEACGVLRAAQFEGTTCIKR